MRDLRLCAARDKKLFDRYVYWTEERRLRFDDTIKKLSEEEFFICEQLVMRIVRRMINQGCTASNGVTPKRSKYYGFLQQPKKSLDGQLSLFPGETPPQRSYSIGRRALCRGDRSTLRSDNEQALPSR